MEINYTVKSENVHPPRQIKEKILPLRHEGHEEKIRRNGTLIKDDYD